MGILLVMSDIRRWETSVREASDLCEALKTALVARDLEALVLSDTRIRVNNGSMYGAQTIYMKADRNGVPVWHWSWDEPIWSAADVDTAAGAVARAFIPRFDPRT